MTKLIAMLLVSAAPILAAGISTFDIRNSSDPTQQGGTIPVGLPDPLRYWGSFDVDEDVYWLHGANPFTNFHIFVAPITVVSGQLDRNHPEIVPFPLVEFTSAASATRQNVVAPGSNLSAPGVDLIDLEFHTDAVTTVNGVDWILSYDLDLRFFEPIWNLGLAGNFGLFKGGPIAAKARFEIFRDFVPMVINTFPAGGVDLDMTGIAVDPEAIPLAASAPEPGTIVLSGVAILGVFIGWRGRSGPNRPPAGSASPRC